MLRHPDTKHRVTSALHAMTLKCLLAEPLPYPALSLCLSSHCSSAASSQLSQPISYSSLRRPISEYSSKALSNQAAAHIGIDTGIDTDTHLSVTVITHAAVVPCGKGQHFCHLSLPYSRRDAVYSAAQQACTCTEKLFT